MAETQNCCIGRATAYLSALIFIFNVPYGALLSAMHILINTTVMAVFLISYAVVIIVSCGFIRYQNDPLLYSMPSCLSIMILLGSSFRFIAHSYYYKVWPKNPQSRYNVFTLLTLHQFGLFPLIASILVMYYCKCTLMAKNKRVIYKLLLDIVDIYEIAKLFELDAPICTLVRANVTANNIGRTTWSPMTIGPTYNISYNNNTMWPKTTTAPFISYNRSDMININVYDATTAILPTTLSYICTDPVLGSWFSWVKAMMDIFCSLSFLFFLVIFFQAIDSLRNAKNSSRNETLFKKFEKCRGIPIIRLLQDLPFLVIRLTVWIQTGVKTQVIFVVKNLVSTFFNILEIWLGTLPLDQPSQPNGENDPKRQYAGGGNTNQGFAMEMQNTV